MTDLKRAQQARVLVRTCHALGPMEWAYTGEQIDELLAKEFAAIRREGAELADWQRKLEREAGAEEMRERAARVALAHEAPTTARAILDLPLTPEES